MDGVGEVPTSRSRNGVLRRHLLSGPPAPSWLSKHDRDLGSRHRSEVLADVGAALDAPAIDKSFGMSRVLHDVNMRIAPGKCALLGENGAGKSTLIRIIAGVYDPTPARWPWAVLSDRSATSRRRAPASAFHQELPSSRFSVAENLMPQAGIPSDVVSWVDDMHGPRHQAIFDRLGVAIDVRRDAGA